MSLYAIRLTEMGVHPNLFVSSGMGPISQAEYDANPNGYILVDWSDPNDPGQQLANANLSFEIYVKLETDEGFPWRAIDRVSTSIEGLTNTQLTQLISSSLTLPTVTDVNSLDELILRQFDSMTRSRVASGEEGDSVQVDLGRDQSNEFLLTFDYESAQGLSSTYKFRPVDFFDDVSNIRNYGSSLNDVIFNGSTVEFAITLDGESFVGRLDTDSGSVSQFIRIPFVNEGYISAFSKLAVAGSETLVVTGSSLSGASIGKFTADGEYLSVGEVGTSTKSPSILTPYYGKKFDLSALDSGDFVFVSAEYPGYEVNAYFLNSDFETTSYLTLNDLDPSWGYASISDVQITQANNRWATVWKGDFPTGLKIVVGDGAGDNVKDIYSLTSENYDWQGVLPEEYRIALSDNGALALLSRFPDRYDMTWFEDSSDLSKFHTVQIGSFEDGLSPRIQDFAIRDGVVDVVTSVATFTVPTPLLDGSVSLMLGQSETSFDEVALLLSADSESGTGELLTISMPILNFGFGPIHAIEAEITLTHQGGLVVNKTMSLSSESEDDLKSMDVQILPSASLESVTVASVKFQGSAGSVTLDQNTTPSDLFPAPSIVLPDLINPSITESLASLKVVDGDQHVHHSSSSEFVIGDDGDDQFTVSESTVSEFFVGGDGQDSVYVHDDQLARGAVIDLASGEIVLGSGKSLAVNGVEDAYGTSHDDRLVGDSQANSLSGGLGRDVLNGGFGADTLYGGDGDDDLSGGAGSDLLIGGAGNDEIEAGHNALLELENISGSDYFRYLGGTSPREYTESYDSGTGIPMNDLGGVSIGTATGLNPSQLSVGFKVFFDHSFGSDRVDLFSGKNFVVYAIRGDADPDGYSNSFGGEAVLHIEAFRADGTTRDTRLGSIDLGSESTVVLGIDAVNGRVSHSESGSGGGSSYIGSFEGLNPSFSAAELVLEGSTYPGDVWIAEFSWKSIDGQVVTSNVSINDFSIDGGNALNAAQALVTAINTDDDLPVVAGTPWSVVRPEGGAHIRVPLTVDPSKGSDLFSVSFSVTDLNPNDNSATHPIDARVENISGISYEESLITLSDAASGVMLGSLSIDSFTNFEPLSSSFENFNSVENWSTFYDFSNLRDVSTLKNLGYLGEAGDLEIGNSIASTALDGVISRGLDLSNVPNDSNLMLSGIGTTPSGFIKAGFIFHGFESESQYSQTLYKTPYICLDLIRPNDDVDNGSSFDLRVRYPGGEQNYTIVDLPVGDLVTVDVMYDSEPTDESDVQLALTFDPGSGGTYTSRDTPWNLAEKQTESFIAADFNGQIVQLAGRNSFSYGSGSKDGREIRPIYDDSGILLSKHSIGYDYILNFDTLDGDFEVENLLGQQSNSDVNPSVTMFEGSSYVTSTTELNSEILMFGDRSKRSANDSDIIDGGEGYDVLSYLESSESIVLRAKDQEVEHGEWTDSYSNIEAVRGSKLGDKFLGGEESLVGHGDDGDDLILGSMADDHLYGDSGNDTIIGNNEGFLTSYELKGVVVDHGTEGWDLTRSVNSAVVEILASDANTEFSYSIMDYLDLEYDHIQIPIIAIDDGSVGYGLRVKGQSELLDVSSMFASEVETATGESYVLFEFAGQLGGSNTSLSLIVDGEGSFFDNIQSYDGTWGVDIESQIVSQKAITSAAYAPGAIINIQDWDILNQSTLKVGGLSDDYIDGGGGSDLLDGGGGVDYILGGDGDDEIHLAADSHWGDDAIAKNTTLSELSVGAWRASSFKIEGLGKYEKVLDGGADSDTIIMGDEGEALFLHDALSDFYPDDGLNLQTDISGRDSTARVLGIETIYAGGGDDLLDMTSFDYASDTGLTAYGEDGNDTLWATELNDTLYGGMGDDTLFGDAGNDIFYGGEGFDRFEFSVGAGFDQIMDFNIDEDILAFYARKSRFGSEGDDTELALSNGVVSWEDVSIDLMDDTLNNLEDLNVEFTVV